MIADTKAMVIKEIKDPNKTHAFTMKKINKVVNNNLKKLNISLIYKGELKEFNQYYFNMFCDYYDLKNKIEFCYQHKQFKNITYTYSPRIIDFIIDEIKKDPENIINNIKERLKRKNKLTPGAKEFYALRLLSFENPALVHHELTYLYYNSKYNIFQ